MNHLTLSCARSLPARTVIIGIALVFAPTANAQEKRIIPKDDVYWPAAKESYSVPPELKNFQLLSTTPLKITNAKLVEHLMMPVARFQVQRTERIRILGHRFCIAQAGRDEVT